MLNAAFILGIGGMLTYRAWRGDRRPQPEPAPAAEPASASHSAPPG